MIGAKATEGKAYEVSAMDGAVLCDAEAGRIETTSTAGVVVSSDLCLLRGGDVKSTGSCASRPVFFAGDGLRLKYEEIDDLNQR